MQGWGSVFLVGIGLALCFHGCAWFSSAPQSQFCLLLVPRLALLLGLGVCGCTCIEPHWLRPALLQTL